MSLTHLVRHVGERIDKSFVFERSDMGGGGGEWIEITRF